MSTPLNDAVIASGIPGKTKTKTEMANAKGRERVKGNKNYKGFVAGVFSGIAKLSG